MSKIGGGDAEISARFDPIHTHYVRGIKIFFNWESGTPINILFESLDDGVNYLAGYLGEYLAEGGLNRKDDLSECGLVVELTVTLTESKNELYDMFSISGEVADLMDRNSIRGVTRQIYHNYQREGWRLKKEFEGEELQEKLAELKRVPDYIKVDQDFLQAIDIVVVGQK